MTIPAIIAMLAPHVIKLVAGKLGVDPTPEAVSEAHAANPARVEEVIHKIDEAEIARAAADAAVSYHGVLKGDQTAVDKATRLWRPFNGFAFAINIFLIVITGCIAVLFEIDLAEVIPIISMIGTAVGAQAGVVGVQSWGRTQERRAGKV